MIQIHTHFLMKALFQLEIVNFNFLHAADTNEDWFVCLAALCSWSLTTQTYCVQIGMCLAL